MLGAAAGVQLEPWHATQHHGNRRSSKRFGVFEFTAIGLEGFGVPSTPTKSGFRVDDSGKEFVADSPTSHPETEP